MGVLHGNDNATAPVLMPVAELYGAMIGQDRRTGRISVSERPLKPTGETPVPRLPAVVGGMGVPPMSPDKRPLRN